MNSWHKEVLGAYEKFGPYFYAQTYKDSFWRALFRSRNQDLPEGLVDVFFLADTWRNLGRMQASDGLERKSG